jgi:hypothetical protein
MTVLAEYGNAQFHIAVWEDPRFSGGKSDSQIVAEAAECLKELADAEFFKGMTISRESVQQALSTPGTVVMWTTRLGAIVKVVGKDGVRAYPTSEIDTEEKLDGLVELAMNEAGGPGHAKTVVTNGCVGLGFLSPQTMADVPLDEVPEEEIRAAEWNLCQGIFETR